MTAGEQLLEEGRQQGLEQGRQEGRLEGERRLLLRILARLGTITPGVSARVEAAEAPDLERWAEAALSAEGLTDVFRT